MERGDGEARGASQPLEVLPAHDGKADIQRIREIMAPLGSRRS
jgi:hypothetical protein